MKFSAKILLFGEYLVLHKSDALLIPLSKYSGELEFLDNSEELRNGKSHSNKTLKNLHQYIIKECELSDLKKWFDIDRLELDIEKGLYFNSNIPVGYGIGSSGALTAALFNEYGKIRFNEIKTDMLELKKYLASLESYFHGKSSGLDPLLSYLHQGIHVQDSDMKVNDIDYSIANPFLIDTKKSRSTGDLVNIYHKKSLSTEYFDAIKNKLIRSNNQCIHLLSEGKETAFFSSLRELSSLQFEYFREMILTEYESLWTLGLETGDFYLKLCGAGGGGYLLGFTPNKEVLIKLKEEYQLGIIKI